MADSDHGITADAFESIEWHDAVLETFLIDRTDGETTLILRIKWPDGRRSEMQFPDCYHFMTDWNLGILGPESLQGASCSSAAPELDELRAKWRPLGLPLEDVLLFVVQTNTSGSVLKILARSYTLTPLHARS